MFINGETPEQQAEPLVLYLIENYGPKFYIVGSDYEFPQKSSRVCQAYLKQFGGEMSSIDRGAYRLVTSRDELEELNSAMRAAGRFALDTETTSLDSLRADLVGLSFCADEKVAWYVPVAHAILEPQLTWDEARDLLAPPICGSSISGSASPASTSNTISRSSSATA